MADIVERVSPEDPDLNFENHCKVYRFFADSITSGRVLDIGCGNGYGAEIVSESGLSSYTGVDYSNEAMTYASQRFGDFGAFKRMDAQSLDFDDDTFDWVISSENLEHLNDPGLALKEKARVLKPEGFALIGTPNKEMFSPGRAGSPNPFHKDEFYYQDLLRLLLNAFESVMIFENTFTPEEQSGREMRSKRFALGVHGVLHQSEGSISFAARQWRLRALENTHSFMVIAAQPRPLP